MSDKEYIEQLENLVKEFFSAGMYSMNGVLDDIDENQFDKAINLAVPYINKIRNRQTNK
jgi:hypothetical protein